MASVSFLEVSIEAIEILTLCPVVYSLINSNSTTQNYKLRFLCLGKVRSIAGYSFDPDLLVKLFKEDGALYPIPSIQPHLLAFLKSSYDKSAAHVLSNKYGPKSLSNGCCFVAVDICFNASTGAHACSVLEDRL